MSDDERRNSWSTRAVWTLIGVETLCFLGSEVARFGVSVWIYQATQSVYAFEMLLLANTLPGVLVAPIAGSVVDRFSRKAVMIGAATVALCGTLTVLTSALLGVLSMVPIVIGAVFASLGEAFQWPALAATVPLVTTKDDLPRYNGFVESGRAASTLAGPVVGGLLFATLKLPGLLAVEVLTFTTATIVVSMLTIPRPEPQGAGESAGSASLLQDSLFGLRWIIAHKPLFKFLLVAVFANFFLSIGMVLMTPYGLGLLDETRYGIANGLFGAGMIAGGLVYGPLAGRFRNVHLFLWSALIMGALYAAYGFARGVVALAVLNFLLATLMTVGNAGILTIWQLKVPEDISGRVLSAQRAIAFAVGPIAYLLAGPLADQLVPRFFSGSGGAAAWMNATWGASKASQIGFLFTAMGVILVAGFGASWAVKDVREVEDRPV
jgi:MFS family permease